MPGSRIWFPLTSSTAYFITIARPSPNSFKLWDPKRTKNYKKQNRSLISQVECVHVGKESQIIGSLLSKSAIFHNTLPFTSEVVRLPPLAEVAGELVNGEKPSEHNVSGETEETGGDVVEPFGFHTAAQSELPAQNQQNERWWSHDAEKLETES